MPESKQRVESVSIESVSIESVPNGLRLVSVRRPKAAFIDTDALSGVLCSTNMIESPNSGLRRAIGRVTRWRDGGMVLRWVGRALSDIELRWRRIDGADLLWILRQNLDAMNNTNTIRNTTVSQAA